jgi:hypothetical protein
LKTHHYASNPLYHDQLEALPQFEGGGVAQPPSRHEKFQTEFLQPEDAFARPSV